MLKIVLDDRDKTGSIDMKGHVRYLKYPPTCIVVAMHINGNVQVRRDLSAHGIPLFPTFVQETIKLPKLAGVRKRKRGDDHHGPSINIYRHVYSLDYMHANSVYRRKLSMTRKPVSCQSTRTLPFHATSHRTNSEGLGQPS